MSDPIPLKTPELDKLNSCVKERNTLMQFLEWLQDRKIELASYHEHTDNCRNSDCEIICGMSEERLYSLASRAGEQAVYEFLELDTKKIEEERMALLDAISGEPR